MAGLPDSGGDWAQVGASAGSGALAGSAFGPWGTAIGGLVGAGIGLLTLPDGTQVPTNNSGYISPELFWGRDPQASQDYTGFAMSGARDYGNIGRAIAEQGTKPRMPQAWENQELSDREAMSRGWDQAGSLQLSREAAMGEAPSQAQYLMQSGLNDAIASQQALQGSARGAAGIALAGGNAAANSANLQSQAFNQNAALRAQEMATARGLYGGLAGQQRAQDMERLGMGNDMAKYNAGLDDAYAMGMLGHGAQYGSVGAQWGNLGMGPGSPYSMEMGADISGNTVNAASANNANTLNAGAAATNVANSRSDANAQRVMVGTTVNAMGQKFDSMNKTPTSGTSTSGTMSGGYTPPSTSTSTDPMAGQYKTMRGSSIGQGNF